MAHGSITASRSDLASAVTYVATGISKRPVVPVLGGMSAKIWAGVVTFGAYDYETCTEVKVHGTDYDGGSVLVNGAGLVAAIKSLPAGKRTMATLTITDAGLVITPQGTEATVPALDATEYPCMPALPLPSGITDASAFLAAITRVLPAVGTDDTLPALTCMSVTSDAGQLELAGTDRYRLAVDRVPWTGPDGVKVLLPRSVLAPFAKTADRTGKISVHVGDTHAGLSDGVHTVITRTSDREFPKYRQFLRTDHGTAATVDAKTLHGAMARAAKLSGKTDRTGFDVTSGRITVTAVNEGTVAGVQHVAAEVDGPDYPAGFNAGYLASMLAGFAGPVHLGFKTSTTRGFNDTPHTSQGRP